MKTHLIYLLIIACLAASLKFCAQKEAVISTVTKTVTVRDTVMAPALAPREVIRYKYQPALAIDTQAVIESFLEKKAYQDTSITKLGMVIIYDTVYRGLISGRSIVTDLRIPETVQTVGQPPRAQLYIGPNIGEGLGLSLALKTKNDHVIDAGYMFSLHGSVFYLSYKWKIKLHK